MHTERPHIVSVPVAPGFVWAEDAGALLDDLDYYVWIPDYDLPSTLVVNLEKGRYKIPQPSGHVFMVLYNDQRNTFPVNFRLSRKKLAHNISQVFSSQNIRHNLLAENLMGKPQAKHPQGSDTDLDWYGNIVVVKTNKDGKVVDVKEDDVSKAVEDVTM